jgi:predicted RNA binding protein YcfA (HicA-like mRNA interferase family)
MAFLMRSSGVSARVAYSFSMQVSDLLRAIAKDGWFLVRQRGSHRQFHHPVKSGTVTVAGKPSIEVPPGTLNSVLKQAGLKE